MLYIWKSWTYQSVDTLINRFKKEQVRVASGRVSAKTKNVGIWSKKNQNNVLKNWESEKVVSLQCLRVLQCTCSYVTALYKGSSWFMKSTPEALPGRMSWPLEFYCNNKDTDKMQIPAMAKIHHQATLFILLVMFFLRNGLLCLRRCLVLES